MSTRRTGSQAIVDALLAEGVEYVFGLPGGHSVPVLYDEMAKRGAPRAFLTRHETAGAFAALGYAQVTRKAGVCQGTAGPGFGQLLPGLHEAWYSRIPLVAIAPNSPVPTYGMGALQEFPQIESVLPFAKWWYRVDHAAKAAWAVRRAFTIAQALPPGPVLLDIPLDIGAQPAPDEEYRAVASSRPAADPEAVEECVRLLLAAEMPVLVCGRGVHQAEAYDELRELAELLGSPVLWTNHGKTCLPDDHPLNAGGVGVNRTPCSEAILQESDCWVWIGSQIEEFAVGKNWPTLPASRRFININADATQFGRNWAPDLSLCADARLALGQIAETVRRAGGGFVGRAQALAARICRMKSDYREQVTALIASSTGPVHPAQFLRAVQESLESEDIVVLGEGATRVWTATELLLRTPGNWVSASDYGCMGYANGAALGAAVGRPGVPVWCFTGDGSFQMQMQELATAAQYRLPIAFVIFNNSCLGWIKWRQEARCKGQHFAVDFTTNWCLAQAAPAAGVEGVLVDAPEKCTEAVAAARRAFAEERPVLIEVLVPWCEQTPGFVRHHASPPPPPA